MPMNRSEQAGARVTLVPFDRGHPNLPLVRPELAACAAGAR